MLFATARRSMPSIAPTWLRRDGRLDPDRLLEAFVAFWRQHAEVLLARTPYAEVAPHLVLMAFLHRVVNGHGRVEREYAIGSGRMDLLVEHGPDRVAMDLKAWRPGEPDPQEEGLIQLDRYLGGLRLDRGWLVIFDRRPGSARLRDRTAAEAGRTPGGRAVMVIRLDGSKVQRPVPATAARTATCLPLNATASACTGDAPLARSSAA